VRCRFERGCGCALKRLKNLILVSRRNICTGNRSVEKNAIRGYVCIRKVCKRDTSVDKMSIDNMTVDAMSLDEMSED
jgi:hypothetical protein